MPPSPAPAPAPAEASPTRSPFGGAAGRARVASALDETGHLVTAVRRARRIPEPPHPPFAAAKDPYAWQVRLPSAVGRKVVIRVGESHLELGGQEVALGDVVGIRSKLQYEAALFRAAASARMNLTLRLDDGTTVKVAARNAASAGKAGAIVATLAYLWDLLGDRAGTDQRSDVAASVTRGVEVPVGGLRLTSIGVAWKRQSIIPWSHIGNPVVERLRIVVPTDDGPIEVPVTAEDAFLLPTLLPELRIRFS